MKNWKKIATAAAAVALSATLVFSVTACDNETGREINEEQYYLNSEQIYDSELGDFYTAYQAAKAITGSDPESVSERYALMAIAEAKLLESAVMVPTTSNGGNYAISKAVPHTYTYTLWGNDAYRYHQMLVANEFLTSGDRDEVTEMYNEALEDGGQFDGWASADAYSDEVRSYLEGRGYTIKDTYSIGYSSDPTTYDVLATSQAVDSEVLVNTYDGLVEYDELGNLQYALADYYDVSDDGLHYYFHIRDGANWYTRAGTSAYAEVTADDFVAGFQHMMDTKGGLEYLVEGVIEGATEYIYGTTTDFSDVGVKAGTYDETTGTFTEGTVDSTTGAQSGEWVEYTLVEECSYFMTMLSYGVFAPMNRAYYLANGGGFSTSYSATATGYVYGTSPDYILYCGPYIINIATANSTIQFTANPGYWNADHINLQTITWTYNDGTIDTRAFTDVMNGLLDGCGLNDSALALARRYSTTDIDGNRGTYFDLFGYVSATDATTFMAFYNLNRQAFANYNDSSVAVSPQSEEDAERTNAAMNNVHFRRAISFAFDRTTFNAQSVGDALGATSLRNSYTPGNYVTLTHETTVTIGDEEVTYPVGTFYGEIMQAQLDADEVPITVWAAPTTTEDGGTYVTTFEKNSETGENSSDGYDGWYNVENAKAELQTAISELQAEGVEVSADNPIQIDYVYVSSSTVYSNRATVYKQSLEEALDGCVQVNLVAVSSASEWYYSGYYPSIGYDMNYDMNDVSGWGPDYGDPATYLDTMLPDGYGYMTKAMGLW